MSVARPLLLKFLVLVLRRVVEVGLLKEPRRILPAAEAAGQRAQQRVFERFSKVPIEVRVDERVYRRVEVAYPEKHADNGIWRRTVVIAAQCADYVPETI